MSVIIKDMEVPQYCGACHVGFCKQIGCELYIGFDDYATSRHPDCPISNISTPHGRLIDADAFEKENAYFWNRDFINPKYEDTLADLVNAAPTIIETEE